MDTKPTDAGSDEIDDIAARARRRFAQSQGEPGVFYVIRLPLRWQIISHSGPTMGERSCREIWYEYLAEELAGTWGRTLNIPVAEMLERLKPLWKGFPRGRVELTQPGEFTVYHGDDFEPVMNVTLQRIESAFGLHDSQVTLTFDSEESCAASDRDELCRLLSIEPTWKAQ